MNFSWGFFEDVPHKLKHEKEKERKKEKRSRRRKYMLFSMFLTKPFKLLHDLSRLLLKGCVRYIFASLLFKSKRELL